MKKQLDERDPPGWYRCRLKNFINKVVHAVCWWNGTRLHRFDNDHSSFLESQFEDFERMELAE